MNKNANRSGKSCELNNDQLDAVSGGVVDVVSWVGCVEGNYCVDGDHKEGTVRIGQTLNSPTKPHAH